MARRAVAIDSFFVFRRFDAPASKKCAYLCSPLEKKMSKKVKKRVYPNKLPCPCVHRAFGPMGFTCRLCFYSDYLRFACFYIRGSISWDRLFKNKGVRWTRPPPPGTGHLRIRDLVTFPLGSLLGLTRKSKKKNSRICFP